MEKENKERRRIPQDASFIQSLDFVHIVVTLFRNPMGKPELSVFAYKNQEDAQKRFDRLMAFHNSVEGQEQQSPLILTETFYAGIYETFEQSLFVEKDIRESDKTN